MKDMQTKRFYQVGLIILSLMLTAMPTIAQGAAEVWLEKATEKLQNKGAELTFRINEEGMRVSGKLLIDGPKFHFDSDEMKIWYDGTTQWTLQMGGGYSELYINNPTTEDQQGINPYQLLNTYKEYFTPIDGGEKNMNGKLVHMVKLQSTDESQGIGDVVLYITSDGTLSLLEFITPDGHPYKIEIRSMRNGLTFPKDTFTYSAKDYPADEVVDLR